MQHIYEGNQWSKQSWENDAQYAAFLAYRDCGSGRTIDAAYKAYRKERARQKSSKKQKKAEKSSKNTSKRGIQVSGTFAKWRVEFEWDERVRSFDNYEQEALDKAQLEKKKQEQEKFTEEVGVMAREAARRILSKPSMEKVRRRYKIVDNVKVLVEEVTEQSSIVAASDFVLKMLEYTMPQFNPRQLENNELDSDELSSLRRLARGASDDS